MRYQCPYCQFLNAIPEDMSGKMVACHSCKKAMRAPSELEDGCVLGDFLIKDKIGSGSIGTVYRVEDLALKRIIAIKVLSKQFMNARGLNNFLTEARATAKLSHPNIVHVYSIDEADGYCYIAMPLLTGRTIKERLRKEHTIPVDEALHLIQQIAEALHYAWTEAELIHRDVKPENIIVSNEGVAILTDMGLAMKESAWSANMEISGSPSYMSPEQFCGEKLDTRSDIYSLGVTLYEMLSGQLPFRGTNVQDVASQHLHDDPVSLSKLGLDIPQMVSALVKKMMHKHASERFQNMEDLLNQIWRVRQKTAPDRDLVPSVHTVSIRRLDYDQQLAILRKNPATSSSDLYDTFSRNRQNMLRSFTGGSLLPFVLIGLIFMGLFGIIIFMIFHYSDMQRISPAEHELYKRISSFRDMITLAEPDAEHVRSQSEMLIKEIRELRAPEQYENIVTLLQENYTFTREIKRLKTNERTSGVLEKELATAQERIKLLQNDLVVAQNAASCSPQDTQKALNALRDQVNALKEEQQLGETKNQELTKKIDMLLSIIEDQLIMQSYTMLRSNMAFAAQDICCETMLSNTTDAQRELLNSVMLIASVYTRCEALYEKPVPEMLNRTVEINGQVYTVISFNRGKVACLDKNKESISFVLNDLTVNEVAYLLRPAFAPDQINVIKFVICLQRGALGDALLYATPGSPMHEYAKRVIKQVNRYSQNAFLRNKLDYLNYEKMLMNFFGKSTELRDLKSLFEVTLKQSKAYADSLKIAPEPVPVPPPADSSSTSN